MMQFSFTSLLWLCFDGLVYQLLLLGAESLCRSSFFKMINSENAKMQDRFAFLHEGCGLIMIYNHWVRQAIYLFLKVSYEKIIGCYIISFSTFFCW